MSVIRPSGRIGALALPHSNWAEVRAALAAPLTPHFCAE
jgi:hypothetical protein